MHPAPLLLWLALCPACADRTDGSVPLAGGAPPYVRQEDAGVPALAVAVDDATPAPRAPRRISLLIAIADYRHFTAQGRPGETDLEGPRNDVERMRASLRRWGFGGEQDTRVLTDADASRAGIEDALAWLASRATDTADAVVIYYSGHGSFTRDTDGDEARVTPGDTLDEALIPWDARDIHDAPQLLVDDRIREVLGALGTDNVTVIIDACYSGTATRGAEEPRIGRAKGPIAAGPAGPTIDLLDRPGHTLLTAASARQVAQELPFRAEDRVFGVFTYHLTRVLDGAAPSVRYDDILQQVRMGVSGALVQQIPQLEGDRSARLFNVGGDVPRRAFALATPLAGGRVELDIGAIHGVRDSARFDVFAPGESSFRGQPLAQVQVETIEDARSTARVIGETVAVPAQARAVMARVPLGAKTLAQLPVWVSPGASEDRAFIERLDFVRVVADSGAAQAHVLRDAGANRVRIHDVVLPPLEGETDLCGPLRRAFAIASFDLLQNPQAPLDLEVRLRIVPRGADPAERRGAVDTVYIDEPYDVFVHVAAPADARFFMTAVVMGYASDPLILHPRGDALNQPFPLNVWHNIFPDVSISEPAGLEMVKVVVNSEQFDLHSLVDALPTCGLRSRGGEWKSNSSSITGWKSMEHRVLVLPARR